MSTALNYRCEEEEDECDEERKKGRRKEGRSEGGAVEMEPLVFEIANLLNSTLSPDNLVLDAATRSLLTLSLQQPAAPLALLSITTGHYDQGLKIAAATFLKNFTNCLSDQRNATIDYRNQLAQALLLVEPPVFRVLVEAFRIVVALNFVKDNSWPQLVHDLKSAIQSSDIFNGGANHPWKTLSALSILQTVVRPFQYFLDAKLAKEPVPPQLEQLAVHILVPLISTLHSFVDKVMPGEARTNPDFEKVILIICKCIYFSVRSHMPAAIAPQLPLLCHDLFRILDSLPFDDISEQDQNALRFKSGKRVLLIFCTLVSRHRKHADRLMEDMVHCSIRIVKHSSSICNLNNLSERVISLAYDVISHILETGPGWRLVSSHFSLLLECAIFPALKMNQKDVLEWKEDADEYLRKNLPSDLEEISGWRDDLFTARKSANNLLGLISISKGLPMVSYNTKGGTAKRKKGVKCKNREQCRSVGELLVMPFLSKFPTPLDCNTLPEALNNYYGVLMAYGGLQDFLKNKDSDYTMLIVQNRVLPLYASSPACPYLLATANWILGELASCLPEEMNADVYSSLLKSLALPDIGNISCYPVRISSAGAISALLENDYLPIEWSPLLQILLDNVGITKENESAVLFELLATTVEVGGKIVSMHIPMAVTALAGIIAKHLPPHPEPWPQVVEQGFGALRAMAQAWESSLPDESDQVELSQPSIFGWTIITKSFAALLQKAWTMMEEENFDTWHLPSCFDDVSLLLGNVIKFIIWTGTDVDLEIQKLLKVWAYMLADWHAWEEAEDMAMFDTIQDLINLHKKYGLRDFFSGSIPSPPAPPVPQCSILDCITSFVIEALSARNTTVWRACLCFHVLINVKSFALEAESIRQKIVVSFCLKAYSRLMEIQSNPVALWKPLLLVTLSCYLYCPDVVENILMNVDKNAFISWAGTLGYLISNHSGLFSSLQEAKLAVLTLAKVVERMVLAPTDAVRDALNDSFISLMKAVIHMKELQEKEEEDGPDNFDDEEDVDEDSENEDESENDREEPEEEFLQRYAKTAEELENGLVTEGGEEDEARKLELGTLGEVDQYAVVFSLIQRYGQVLSGLTIPSQIVKEFVDLCPEFKVFFKVY